MQRFIPLLIKWLPAGIGGFCAISLFINSQFILGFLIAVATTLLVVRNIFKDEVTRLPSEDYLLGSRGVSEQGSRAEEMKWVIPYQGGGSFQIPPQYEKLANYLAKEEWKKADEETTRLLMDGEHGNLFGSVWNNLPESISSAQEVFNTPASRIQQYCESIPCENLIIINIIWLSFSRDRFGFSVQNQIAIENNVNDLSNFELLAERLAWKRELRQNKYIYYEDLTFNINAPIGHLPANCFFIVDEASGFIPKDDGFGKQESSIMWAPFVWMSVLSRFNTCSIGWKEHLSNIN